MITCHSCNNTACVCALPSSSRKIEPVDVRREALVRAAGRAELFLAMRAAYTASLAAMSATGYCAGVGDRHMGNIMLHASGRLVPIDFGCGALLAAKTLPSCS